LSHTFGARFIFGGIAMLSLLSWIIASDNRLRLHRFWTHWLGVGLCVISEMLWLASGVIVFGLY